MSEISIDVAEALSDQYLEDIILRNLPVLGDAFKIIKAGEKIRDYIFIRKIMKFLFYLDKVNPQDKHNFSQKLNEDSEYSQKVGEYLLLILEWLNDLDKPELLAKVFKAYVERKIDFTQFKRLGAAIDIAFIEDLNFVVKTNFKPNEQQRVFETIFMSGLTKIDPKKNISFMSDDNTLDLQFILSPIGKLYIKIMKEEI